MKFKFKPNFLWVLAVVIIVAIAEMIAAQETGPPGSVLRVPSTGGRATMGPLDLSSENATTGTLDFPKIGDGTVDASALLQLNSTEKGFIIPRMTTAQRDAIVSPATGLQVYNTDTNTINVFNGSAWGPLGSGGGGGGGVNFLAPYNYDFGQGTAFWDQSSEGTLVVDSSVAAGGLRATFTPTAIGQTISSQLVALDDYGDSFRGRKCQVHIPSYTVAGVDGAFVLKVLNGDDEELLSLDFKATSSSSYSLFQTFDCPDPQNEDEDKRKIKVLIESTSDDAQLKLSEVFLGSGRNSVTVNFNGKFLGELPTSGSWTTNTTYKGLYWRDREFLIGRVLITFSGAPDDVAFSLSLPNGLELDTEKHTATSGYTKFGSGYLNDSNTLFYPLTVNYLSVTSFTTRYFLDGTGDSVNPISSSGLNRTAPITIGSGDFIEVSYKVPIKGWSDQDVLGQTEGHTYETTGWMVDANISGANPSLGTSAVSDYTGITNGGMTLVNNTNIKGVIPAMIPCSDTNPPTGTTCASGDESVGISFNVPKSGTVEVCSAFTYNQVCTAVGTCANFVTFQLVETANNSQSAIQNGNTKVSVGGTGSASATLQLPVKVCSNFEFATSGQKTIRLNYEQNGGSNLSGVSVIGDKAIGDRDIHWTVRPINESMPTPVFHDVRSKVDGGAENSKIRSAVVSCSSSSSIGSNPTNLVSSIGNISSGQCNVTLNNVFTNPPHCSISWNSSSLSALGSFATNVTSNTGLTISCRGEAGNCTAYSATLTCMENL